MNIMSEIRSEFEKICEGDLCRFAQRCKHYHNISACCNHFNKRFLGNGRVYCETYRNYVEIEDKLLATIKLVKERKIIEKIHNTGLIEQWKRSTKAASHACEAIKHFATAWKYAMKREI